MTKWEDTHISTRTQSWAPRLRLRTALWLAALLGGILLPLVVSSQYYQSIFELVLLYAILTEGLDLILGRLGLASVAHGALFVIGAYTLAILTATYSWPYWWAFLAAILVTVVIGVALALITLRLSGHFFAISTVAFASALAIVVSQLSLTGAGVGIIGVRPPPDLNLGGLHLQLSGTMGQYYLALVGLALVVFLIARLDRSAFGRTLALIRQDPVLAEANGVNVFREKIKAFAVSAGICGLAGALFASYSSFVGPTDAALTSSFNVLVYDIIGGVGTLAGPIVGAALVEGSTALESSYAEWGLLVFGIFVLLILLFRPDGIAGGLGRLGDASPGIVGWLDRRRGVRRATSTADEDQAASEAVEQELSVDLLSTLVAPSSAGGASGGTILEARDLVKRYGGNIAVSGVSITLARGEIVGVIGPNGAGKSTLFGMIAGTIRSTSGSVLFEGRHVERTSAFVRARRGIGRTFQTNRLLVTTSGIDNMLIADAQSFSTGVARAVVDSPRTRRLVKEERDRLYALGGLLNLDWRVLDKPVASMTAEEQRLIAIGMALSNRPRVLLLDEPFAGLRDEEARRLENVLLGMRATGLSIMLVEHRMRSVMSLCDRVYVLDQGAEIAHGRPTEVASDERVITAYLGRGAAHA